jgi:hypothetical protein
MINIHRVVERRRCKIVILSILYITYLGLSFEAGFKPYIDSLLAKYGVYKFL